MSKPSAVRSKLAQAAVAAPAVAPAPAPRERRWALLLLPPALVLLGAPGVLYTEAGFIDPWVYLGFMRHFAAFKGQLFPGTYYGSRLSWIIPGAVAHAALPAVAANALLHLGVLFTAVFAMYWLLSRTVGGRAGALTAMCAGAYPFLWAAAGWDYVDGAGIAYYLLALAFTAAAAARRRAWLFLICAGVAYAGLIYSNIAWTLFSPVYPALYVFVRRPSGGRAVIREAGRFALFFGAGWVVVTAVLSVINLAFEGTLWFYAPSVLYSISTIGQANPWKAPNNRWVETAHWLPLPATAAIVSLLTIVRRFKKSGRPPSRGAVFFAANMLYTGGVLAYMECVLGRPALELWFYASYTIPAAFLALGSAIFERSTDWPKALFRAAAAGTVLVAIAVWWPSAAPVWPALPLPIVWTIRLAGLGLLIASISMALRTVRVSIVLALTGMTMLFTPPWGNPLDGLSSRPEAYRRIIAATDAVEHARGQRWVRFWYAESEPFGAEFNAINACYLWGFTWIGRQFPALPATVQPPYGALLVVPSSDPQGAAKAAAVFAPRTQSIRPLGKQRIETAGRGFWLNLFEVTGK